MSFSATVSGGVVTALSLTTGYEAAINTSNFDENQRNLVVTSLGTGGAAIFNQDGKSRERRSGTSACRFRR
jgi:hypothetical protein